MIAFAKRAGVRKKWCRSGTTAIILFYRSRSVISIKFSSSRRASATASLLRGSLSSIGMHSKEYFLLESSLKGFGVAQSSLLLTYAHTVSCTEMFWTITLPLLPRMLTNIIIQLCMLHIFSYCRSFASSSIVHFWRRLVEKPYNRNSSFKHLPLASSSSLITTCNPPCRHLYPTHVSSLYSSKSYGKEFQRTWM
jgi:hypothetical protein